MSGKYDVVVDADLRDIMPRYLEIRAEELALIRQALAEDDAQQISFLGHRLKGSGGGYGIDRLTELGTVLETAGENSDLTTAARAIAELADYLDNLHITYEDRK